MTEEPLALSALTLIGMFWITFKINAQLALLSLVVVPFLYYSVGYYMTHIQERLRKVKGMEAESLSIIHEAISMMRVIVAFGRERFEHGRFRRQGERAVDQRVKVTVRQTAFSLFVNTTTAAGTALVLGFGVYQILQGRMTGGELLVVLSYVASIYQPLEAISTTVGSLSDRFVSLEMAFSVLDTEPEIRDAPGARAMLRGDARQEFALRFVRVEPFVIPKKSLTGDNTERVDTRVLQVIYAVEDTTRRLFVGQQVDVFVEEGMTPAVARR